MAGIGIIGAGIAGLHLGLFLQQQHIPVTIYSDRSAEDIMAGRLPSTPCRFGHTRGREQALRVDHWDSPDLAIRGFHIYVGGKRPLSFFGALRQPASYVDMRLYSGTLLQDFQARGGRVVVGAVEAGDIARLAESHDLMVVASGHGSLTELFPRIPELSPFTAPQRQSLAGLFHGIAQPDPYGVTVTSVSGQGEVFEAPYYSFDGQVGMLCFEGVPGSDFAALRYLRYDEDPRRFETTVLDLLRRHAPHVYERVDPVAFSLTRPLDLLQGAITPTVRRAYTHLGQGKFAVAIGDVFAVNDPVTGQGANLASVSAWTLGEAILDDTVFDERFCQRIEQRLLALAQPVAEFTNTLLVSAPPQLMQVIVAASQSQAIADAYVEGYNQPARLWDSVVTPERAAAFLRRNGWAGRPLAAAA